MKPSIVWLMPTELGRKILSPCDYTQDEMSRRGIIFLGWADTQYTWENWIKLGMVHKTNRIEQTLLELRDPIIVEVKERK